MGHLFFKPGALLSPGVKFMNRFRYARKMALMSAIFILPLALFMALLIVGINSRLESARTERTGLVYIRSLMKLVSDVQQHRGISNAYLRGYSAFGGNLTAKQAQVDRDMARLEKVDREFGRRLRTTDRFDMIAQEWNQLKHQPAGISPETSFTLHTMLINDIISLIGHVTAVSRMMIEPRLDSFYLADALTAKMPLAFEYAGQMRGIGTGAIVPRRLSESDAARLALLSGLVRLMLDSAISDINQALRLNPALRERLSPPASALQRASTGLERLTNLIIKGRSAVTPERYFASVSSAIGTGYRLNDVIIGTLDERFASRIGDLTIKRYVIISIAGLSVLIIIYLFESNYASMRNSLAALVEAATRIGQGKLDINVQVPSRDEMALVAGSFNEMAKSLSEQTERLTALNRRLQGEIADRLEAEKALEKKSLELERSNRDLEQFASIASHDLQEPLLAAASDLKLFERHYRGRIDAENERLLADAIEGTLRMQLLVRNLLDYSRAGAPQKKPLEKTDAAQALRISLESLRLTIESAGAVITHAGLPQIMADPIQMARLFQNLIGNAIKYRGGEPPRIHVGAERGEGEWIFSVRDNGIGIPPEHRERIFELFQRGPGRRPGTGIGLATCKKIVERHGGRIWVESETGKGSVFYFTIPDRQAEAG